MHFTMRIDGTAAHITVHGEIDYNTLPTLRAAAAGQPSKLTELVWDYCMMPASWTSPASTCSSSSRHKRARPARRR
jgi:hypothetical protein